jgi:hypothetical protein
VSGCEWLRPEAGGVPDRGAVEIEHTSLDERVVADDASAAKRETISSTAPA